MTHTNNETPVVEQPATKPDDNRALDPLEFLSTFPNAPTKENIAIYKNSSPGHRIKLFTSSDMKRVYIMRGITAFELQKLQEGILSTVKESNYENELQIAVACKCCIWTSTTSTTKLNEMDIKGSGAGLAVNLYHIVSELSDYVAPSQLDRFTADL